MKPSLSMVALVAVASALVTVGAIELLRGSRPAPEPVRAFEPRPGEPLVPSVPPRAQPAAEEEERLAELERRISALEQSGTSRRAPAAAATGEEARGDDLRELVLDWVAQERETRRLAAELQAEQGRREEREFGARMTAHMLALKHGLAAWEEEKLALVLFEIETRRAEVESGIDPLTDGPDEAERRFGEFDEWADRLLEAELGRELVERLFGED